VRIVFVVSNTTPKECKNIAKGWVKPFFAKYFSTLGLSLFIQSTFSKVVNDYFQKKFEEKKCHL
jgi:hypothetical protein